MVLLVVASNVATLVFARTWARAPELAVRTALGAPRGRVVGQLFFETLLLGSIAALHRGGRRVCGLRYIKGSLEGWPFWVTLQPNPRIIAFVVFLTLLVSVVSGLLPAMRVTRHDLRNTLQAGRGFAFGGFGQCRRAAARRGDRVVGRAAQRRGRRWRARFTRYFEEVPALPKNQMLTAQLGRVRDRRRCAIGSSKRRARCPV